MFRQITLILTFVLAAACAYAATATLTVQGNATVNTQTFALTGTGTATLTGYGTAQINFANTPKNPFSVSITFDFGSGNVLQGIFTPLTTTLPQPGKMAPAAISVAIASGTGIFAGATGSFPSVSGTYTSTCSPCGPDTTAYTFNGSGDGTLTIPAPAAMPRVSLGSGTLNILGAPGNTTTTGPAYVQNPNAFAFQLTDGIMTISGGERNNRNSTGGPNTALQNMTAFDGRHATISGPISALTFSDPHGATGPSTQVFAIGLLTREVLTGASTQMNSGLNSSQVPGGAPTDGFDGIVLSYYASPGVYATPAADLYIDASDTGGGTYKVFADLTAMGDATGQNLTMPINFTIAFDGANMTVSVNGKSIGSLPFTHDLSKCVLAMMGSSTAADDGAATITYSNILAATPSAVGPPSLLYSVSGDNQTAVAGSALSPPLVVGLVDAYRNPVPGTTVTFSATNAAVAPVSAQTDANGRASTQVTLGNTAGSATVTAAVNGLTAVIFHLTATQNVILPNITGVVNGASFQPGIAAGTWITIQGTSLSPTTRPWATSDFVNGALPTKLDNVSVTINGKAAFVYYISDKQLNVLSPDDPATGPVAVQVTNPTGPSNVFTANKTSLSTALFLFTAKYPAAVHLDRTYVGPPQLIAGAVSTPAHPNETILLFGTGFGATNPPISTGITFTNPAPLAQDITAMVGGQPAAVQAYLISPGLVQFNLTVPDVPDGDEPIVITVGSSPTQDNLFLNVGR